MKALVIDCAVSKLSVAAKNDRIVSKVVLECGVKQSEKLLPAIDYVMKESGLEPKDLDYTAATSGPGTFTGLRLGLSALKALNLAYGTPLYGIPSLDAYAHAYRTASGRVLSVIEAKEDEFFYSFYQKGEKLTAEEDKEIEEILKETDSEEDILVCGPAADKFVDRTREVSPLSKVSCFVPANDCCESLFEIAEKDIEAKVEPMQDYDGPIYVRKSEAEIVLEKKKAEENKNQ